jgi:hypothetical protein
MSDESFSPSVFGDLSSVSSDAEERSLVRAAREEWCGAKASLGELREAHLYWCARFTKIAINRREHGIRKHDRNL